MANGSLIALHFGHGSLCQSSSPDIPNSPPSPSADHYETKEQESN